MGRLHLIRRVRDFNAVLQNQPHRMFEELG
jgi:hypothetical protein